MGNYYFEIQITASKKSFLLSFTYTIVSIQASSYQDALSLRVNSVTKTHHADTVL